jgi:hypothetical protein
VFLGASLALVLSSLIGVALDGLIGRFVPELVMKVLARILTARPQATTAEGIGRGPKPDRDGLM